MEEIVTIGLSIFAFYKKSSQSFVYIYFLFCTYLLLSNLFSYFFLTFWLVIFIKLPLFIELPFFVISKKRERVGVICIQLNLLFCFLMFYTKFCYFFFLLQNIFIYSKTNVKKNNNNKNKN